MFEVEIYGRVRRIVRVEGKSQRAVSGSLGFRARRYGRSLNLSMNWVFILPEVSYVH